MDDIFVARVMSSSIHTVQRDTLVEDAARVLLENEIGSALVVDDDGKLEGILTSTDFVDIVAQSRPKAETTVERYMSTDIVTASAQDSIRDVADLMIEHGFKHVPIVDEDAGAIGIVTTTDLASYLSRLQSPSPDE
ncbi:CBS domain-containing protein [Natronobacterium gregoryi]|uniref:Signal-transduction protein containing cAMP-binding and CBS domains n=3 Tax=Natronobacterium gregoryi TaxID=44930 RepID=L0AE13_NATGS|nr:CBS domain-containing protein [Natronobacterium gregoryi]AFZ72133.1 putative signal-transduction protein containing cAMP-binding and CBS domains [Natronobacterium gregoryi SP2]SFJ54751.1 CBS domain-containing protein [Natronobacterium gregoryi]